MAYKAITGSPDLAEVQSSRFIRTVARCFSPQSFRSRSASGLSGDAQLQFQRDRVQALERLQRLGSIRRPL
jgi:hypothetical protein